MSEKRDYGYIVENLKGVKSLNEIEEVFVKGGVDRIDVLGVVISWISGKCENMLYREYRDKKNKLMEKYVKSKLSKKDMEEIERKVNEELKNR